MKRLKRHRNHSVWTSLSSDSGKLTEKIYITFLEELKI